MLLTTKSIDALRSEKHQQIADDGCKGLTLTVLPSGTKTWAFRYRNKAGKQCRIPLGVYDSENIRVADRVSLKHARETADELRGKVREGRDPVAERQAEREAAKLESEAAAREAARIEKGEINATDSFQTVWASFVADYFPTIRESTASKWHGIYRRVLAPRWDSKALNEITPSDVVAVKKALQKTQDAADSALTVCRVFFKWCSSEDRELIAPNASPVLGIAKVKRPRGHEKKNPHSDRTLSDDEIRWLWKATGRKDDVLGSVVRMLLLSGGRRSEVSHMPKTELNVRESEWLISGKRLKTGVPHRVHLSAEALAVLAATPVIDKCKYRFSTNGKNPVSGYSRYKRWLDRRMAEIAAAECGEFVQIRPWRFHSLRKTVRTGIRQRLGFPPHIAKKCVNHSLGKIDATYDLGDFEPEKTAAFIAWGRHVAGIVSGQPSIVAGADQKAAA